LLDQVKKNLKIVHISYFYSFLFYDYFNSSGKGILAVDESTKTIGKRLQSIGIENTEENRQSYRYHKLVLYFSSRHYTKYFRGLLFSAPGLGQYISGAILYEETLFQSDAKGKPFVTTLKENGIFPGIKVDTGLQPLPGADPIETWCTGLDGLKERAANYYAQVIIHPIYYSSLSLRHALQFYLIQGARFAKWRAVLQITDTCPSALSIQENAWGLARYARAVQESGQQVPCITRLSIQNLFSIRPCAHCGA